MRELWTLKVLYYRPQNNLMDATTASKIFSAFPFRMKLSEPEISKNLDFLVSQVLPVKDKNMEIREECGTNTKTWRGKRSSRVE